MKSSIALLILAVFFQSSLVAKDYPASFFGIESNGTTMNTNSIQKAIDHIHENGGGRLVFHVGRYLTGSFFLKSNVSIHLKEGAVLVGSVNPFDYKRERYWTALILAIDQEQIGISGKGTIDGQGYQLAQNILSMIHRGLIPDKKMNDNDRPNEGLRAQLIFFKRSKHVRIEGITLTNPASWTQQYEQCTHLTIENITVQATSFWNNDGIDVVDCDSVIIQNNYINASDDGICLKSHSPDAICQNVLIRDNTIRSSASGIKFGTYSFGGFKNIEIINNTVFDTYRSAITMASVDGGPIENIRVDSLRAYNTGNAIFLRIGERRPGRKGQLKNVQLSNIYVEIAAKKADSGYPYEGPIEHQPRNISPAIITGMPDVPIENIKLENVEIRYPGGGEARYAKINLEQLDQIPERAEEYPEFSMFRELPAWGFYIRHARHLELKNVRLVCEKDDFRVPIVLDDVHVMDMKEVVIDAEEGQFIHPHRSSMIMVDGVLVEK